MSFTSSQISPFVILWRIMDSCNLSCPFCAFDKRLKFPRKSVPAAEIARMIPLFSELKPLLNRPVLLSWLGGEPTLWPAFADIVHRAADHGLMQSLTTNGTTLGSPSLRHLIARNFAEVTVSVDALGARHDQLRGWKGGSSKLASWLPLLAEEARGSPLKLRANIVLMHGTIDDFPDLCHRLADWGVTQITFNQLGGRDRPEFYPANRLSPTDAAKLRALLPALRQSLRDRSVALLGGIAYVDRIADIAHDLPQPVASCEVARNFLFIDEEGQIAPCAFVGGHFGQTVSVIRTAQDLAAIPGVICAAQRSAPHAACRDCMSTQQYSKFAA